MEMGRNNDDFKCTNNKTVGPNAKEVSRTAFSCTLCGKTYSFKRNLQFHVKSVHSYIEIKCHLCNFTTNSNLYLNRHIFRIHNSKTGRTRNINTDIFKCSYCTVTYKSKQTIRVHEENIHGIKRMENGIKRLKSKIKCPLCSFSSNNNRKEIYSHFRSTHNLTMKPEKYSFQNMKEFNEWKHSIEINTKSSFIKRGKAMSNTTNYHCHRSGYFKSRGQKRRNMRIIGSCKINGYCPSQIKANFCEEGTVSVTYIPTHVGHRNSLKYIRLRPEERRTIAAQILAKKPREEILKNIRDSLTYQELQRIHLINTKDIINIESSFNLNADVQKHEPVSIEAKVNELKPKPDSEMIAYKQQGHEFLCTCMDNSIKNNKCKHTHAVARTLPYEETTPDKNNEQSELIKDTPVEHEEIICETVATEVIESEEEEDYIHDKTVIRDQFEKLLNRANSKAETEFIKKSVENMLSILSAIAPTSDLYKNEKKNCKMRNENVVP